MKTLIEYIIERSTDFQKKTTDTLKLINIFDYCFRTNKYKDNSISLNNKSELKTFYNQLAKAASEMYLSSATKIMRDFDLTSPNMLKKFLYENIEQFKEYHLNELIFKDFNDSETEKEFKKWKSSSEYVEDISDEEAKKYLGRLIVIYDRYNPATHITKPFDGKRGKSTDHIINMYRMDFSHKTGTKYLNCYSILFENYIKGGKDLEEYHDVIGVDD